MGIQLVHTADVLLDACFAGTGIPGRLGPRRRQSLRDSFENIVRRSRDWPAGALLISGNLFDVHRVSRDTVQFLNALFKSLGDTPVIITPGPRDPVVPHSPYVTESWPSNVTIFTKPEWREKSFQKLDLTVYGFGYDGPTPTRNPFGTLRAKAKGVRIAAGYGQSVNFVGRFEPGALTFNDDDIAAANVHYAGVGGFPRYHEQRIGDTQLVYPGAPESRVMHDTGMRHFAEATLNAQPEGVQVTVRKAPAAQTVYLSETLDCSYFDEPEHLYETVRTLRDDSPQRQILHLRLTGACAANVHDAFTKIEDAVGGLFDCLIVEDRTRPVEDFDELSRQDTTLGDFVRRLNRQLEQTEDEARKAMFRRSLEVGIAAFRQESLPLRGAETP